MEENNMFEVEEEGDVFLVFATAEEMEKSEKLHSNFGNVIQLFLLFRISHAHLKFLANHTIVVGHHTRKKFCPDDVSRTSCENSQTRKKE